MYCQAVRNYVSSANSAIIYVLQASTFSRLPGTSTVLQSNPPCKMRTWAMDLRYGIPYLHYVAATARGA